MMFERMAPEQHDTLDGVPEPSENPSLYGHSAAASMLTAAYRAGKLPHAVILAGPQGIGKATFAFHLAQYLLMHPDPNSAPATFPEIDPRSALFRQVAQGAHPAVLHLTRPANEKTKGFKTVLTVDEIRKVSRFLSMTSHDGGYRVVIVDPADDMNTNAANALLKNLEEPPSRTLFILIVHAPGSLLPTIRSRCQTIRMTQLGEADLVAALDAAGQPVPDDQAARRTLLNKASGSARHAILLTQYGGIEIAEALDALVSAPTMDVGGAHRLAGAVNGRDSAVQFEIFNRRALDILSDAAGAAASDGQGARASRLAELWQEAKDRTAETETYNLDKKQHVLSMIGRLHQAMHG
ncbi:DNA polymerase III subunit delta' [Corticibacterium sp. UT-5YL-CI-8]|nr:DNA polymerase III subunit delta' [Tianweitania sp. UT-5YL-CI-8]